MEAVSEMAVCRLDLSAHSEEIIVRLSLQGGLKSYLWGNPVGVCGFRQEVGLLVA